MENLAHSQTGAPTVVLVHGAFADSTSWAQVAAPLTVEGYSVVEVANPLRGVETDAAYLGSVLATIEGPIVLVGHSYSGTVITRAAADNEAVSALVYVAAFIPRVGESSGGLNGMFAGSMLVPENLVIRPTADGLTDLYIKAEKYGEVYAGGLGEAEIAAGALAQRPITNEALAGELSAAPSRAIASWQIVATADNAVPVELQRFLAERAGATVLEADCGHNVAAARPGIVIAAIRQALQS